MKTFTFLTSILAATGLAMAQPPSTPDYTSIPLDPAEVEQSLTAAKVPLAKAVELAETAANGTCVDARAVMSGTLRYEVTVASAGIAKKVMVDAMNGEVSAPTITIASAIKVAKERHNGVVRSATIDFSAELPVAKVLVYGSRRPMNSFSAQRMARS